ncbi:hypothetical protein KA078_01545 [Candidatus Woesebacteria bacterium]|nr:hypothetical protein [Candidatus Woesebacteria bacterium]
MSATFGAEASTTTVENKTTLAKTAQAIWGERAEPIADVDAEWIQQNITSIQEKTRDGLHNTLVYPACGNDILRTLVAYDVSTLIAIDTEKNRLVVIQEQFARAGIPFTLISLDETTQKLTCMIAGQERVILFKQADARLIFAEESRESFDILHLYLPTEADVDLVEGDAASGEEKLIAEKVSETLTVKNYQLIKTGGFLVLGEKPITSYGAESIALLDIAGLEERKITKRHPDTLLTGIHSTADEISRMSRDGCIYHKKNAEPADVISDVVEAFTSRDDWGYVFMEIQRGEFVYLGLDEEHANVIDVLRDFFLQQKSKAENIADKMRAHEVPEEKIVAYLHEEITDWVESVRQIQHEFQEFLAVYSQVVSDIRNGQVTQQTALNTLGIVQGEYRPKSTKWPIALNYLQQSNQQNKLFLSWVQQFVELNTQELQIELTSSY